MDYQHSVHVAAGPDEVFAVLSDPENLVQFVPQLTAIHPAGENTVEVEARYEGHTQRGEASLRSDAESHRIEWGVDGSGYHGSFDVEADGDGSKLSLALSTPHEQNVDSDVEGTLDAVRRLLESQV
jgi:carbon monoxide dehydrogenase subunit G